MKWDNLDRQMTAYRTKLMDDLGLDKTASNNLASVISIEIENVLSLRVSDVQNVFEPVSALHIFEEINSFQTWMDITNNVRQPSIVRVQVIVQNYICFLYLNDVLFKKISRIVPVGSVTEICCKYLTSGPVRAFRNAFAHGKWQYNDDFTGLIYWDWDDPKTRRNKRWEVDQLSLDFWQKLARCVGYVFCETSL